MFFQNPKNRIINNRFSIIYSSNNKESFVSPPPPQHQQRQLQDFSSSSSPPPPPTEKKMTWGEPTWLFFHTLAEKVSEDNFNVLKDELLNFIFLVSSNLPCPICSSHAIEYMKTNNFFSISTKQQLNIFLFNFHNSVNKRKQYELYDYDNLHEKYSKANFFNILNNFFFHFKNNTKSIKMISEDFHRNRILFKFKNWIYNNISFFST